MRVAIIAFMGAAKSGKTLASKHAQTLGFERTRFAGPLKDMLSVLGLTWEQLDGDEKEIPCDLLGGKTPRHAMQTLGTEWRDMITIKLWSNIVHNRLLSQIAMAEMEEAEKRREPDVFVVIDDMRFPHEAEMVRSLGGKVIAIRRAGVEPTWLQCAVSKIKNRFIRYIISSVLHVKVVHPSEYMWTEIEPDITIFNNTTIDDLIRKVDTAVKGIVETSGSPWSDDRAVH